MSTQYMVGVVREFDGMKGVTNAGHKQIEHRQTTTSTASNLKHYPNRSTQPITQHFNQEKSRKSNNFLSAGPEMYKGRQHPGRVSR